MSLRPALVALALLAAAATSAQAPAPAAAGDPTAAAQPSAAALAPEPPAATQGRVGVGVALGASGVLPAIYVPIDIEEARLELELGYEGSPSEDEADSLLRLGVGVFGLVPTDGSVRAYGGVRLRYDRAELAGDTAGAVRLAAALGGEWVPHPSVAIGAEAQVGHAWVTEPDGEPNRFDATAQAFLRVFTRFGARRASAAAAPAAPSAADPSAPPAAAPAAAPRRKRPPPKPLVRCRSTDDCEGVEICYEGYCRR